MQTSNAWSRLRYAWEEGNYPLTKWLIVLNIATFLAAIFRAPVEMLAFFAPVSLAQPWRILTYTILSVDPISLLFYGLMMWWVGGSLERSWGTRFFAIYFVAVAIISALGMSLAAFASNSTASLDSWQPFYALLIAWCMLNPDLEIRLYGLIPILAKWLALGEVLLIFFTHGGLHNPLIGLGALTGCAASFLWVRTRGWHDIHLYSSMPSRQKAKPRKPKPKTPPDDAFTLNDLNPLERIARARRKKQFQRLFEDDEK